MIVCEDVGVRTADGHDILRSVTLRITAPRTAVIGANGSGKTTLVRLFNGLTRPTTGRVVVDDVDVSADRRRVQRTVGFVFANADHQIVYPTPVEDVALSLRAHGVGGRDARERALAQLELVGLGAKADQGVHTLSGGEKHLVALSAVLVLNPAWLVIDEPTTTLDLANRRRVIQVLERLDQRLIVVSHDLELVRTMTETVYVRDGAVDGVGPSDAMVDRYLASMGPA